MANNNWYAITGGNSTGKSTLVNDLASMGYNTVPEAARTIIDQALGNGMSVEQLRADEEKFQHDVARLKEQLENETNPDQLTFFDRGMQDTLAFLRYYGYEEPDWIKQLMEKSKYQKVFILDQLPVYEQDYARIEDKNFSRRIPDLQYDAYAEYGMELVRVPVLEPLMRAKFILGHIRK